MTQTESLISTKAVCLHYAQDVVLHDINFNVREREIVTILGPNGSGKSTFLRILIGALKPTGGQVKHRANLRIGYVPQRLSIDANMPLSVDRFLRLGNRCKPEAKARWVEQVGIVDLLSLQVSHLSGGQLQRVMLAQALLADPHILILDEATQGLDQPGEASFYRLIEQVRNEQGCAVVLVSHDLHVVMSASDRVICLNGHVCCEGAPTIVSAAPEYRALFGLGTEGALALYRHDHDHTHDHGHTHDHPHDHDHLNDHTHDYSHSHSHDHDHDHDNTNDQSRDDDRTHDNTHDGSHDHSHDRSDDRSDDQKQ